MTAASRTTGITTSHPWARAPLIAWLALAAAASSPAAQTPARGRVAAPPRLVLLVVIDQFRADYLTTYGHQWTNGLRRLIDGGAVFTQAAYPYAATFTCAGHATIGTGAFPAVHGMASNTFFDRQSNRTVPCAFDADATSVAFGGGVGKEHHSPKNIRVETFAESLRTQAPGSPQVVSLALKPRSAIAMAGRGGTGATVVWEEDDGTWATSDAYARDPWTDVDAFVRERPIQRAYGDVWDRILPEKAYLFMDDAPGEARPAPWSRTFPHPLVSPSGETDAQFVTTWERSPWSDAYLTDMALHLLATRRLGTTSGTDMLAVSLPALDLIGHEFGPRSHEVQDVLARVDGQIGRLLDAADRQVGRGRYVVVLVSDHGVAGVPEQAAAGEDSGRVSSTELRDVTNAAISRVIGAGTGSHVTAIFDQQLTLAPGVMDRLRSTPGGIDAVKSAVLGVTGLAAVYSVDDILINDGKPPDALLDQWRLSYVTGRGGDFAFAPKAQWMLRSTSGTTHGTAHGYDRRVPMVFYGAGVRPGRYDGPSSPADVAPTLALITGVRLPQAQGRALIEALIR